ncbi:MaoC family dehydratase [Micromonospora psammae]|uniref:MaoC family dehydratase n=1 Tax=Micromonospora sp. CPCC 205556 TaxID=3122398 RepID=UPI002FF24D68
MHPTCTSWTAAEDGRCGFSPLPTTSPRRSASTSDTATGTGSTRTGSTPSPRRPGTGDRQWIHVDPERARSGPFGGTVAHGFLMLSLLPTLGAEVYRVDGVRMGVNYGLDRVRFPAPLHTGSRVRAGVTLLDVQPVQGGLQVANEVTLEREGGDKPCCVARTLARLYF